MQFTATLFTLVLAATSCLAAPTPETHFLSKRDAVCGQDFRSLVNNDSCQPNSAVYVLGDKGAPEVVKKTHPPLPANAQCDHVVELQLLDEVAKSSGLCEVLTALQAASPAKSKTAMLSHAAQHISAIQNLNYLDAKINNQKKTVVMRALNGQPQGDTAEDKAVGNYFALVKGSAQGVVSTLDTDIAAIIHDAHDVLSKLPDGKGGARSRDPKDVVKRNLKEALDAYKSTTTVSAAFANVLDKAPHS